MDNIGLYDSLVHQIDKAKDELAEAKEKKRKYDEKISQLKSAKKKITTLKQEFEGIKKRNKTIINKDYKWKGKTYKRYQSEGKTLISEDAAFYNQLDDVLDAINSKLTAYENKRLKIVPVIGDLAALINSLATKIENSLN